MFTYDFQSAPLLSTVRMMVPDTVAPGIFSDDEVNQAIYIESAQGLYTSSQFVSGAISPVAPQQVYSVRRAAALLVDIMANNWGKLAIIEQLLDIKISGPQAAAALGTRAQSLRDTEANSGSFAIAEWVVNNFTAQERVYKQMLRLYPG
jgi:hypothetical protein